MSRFGVDVTVSHADEKRLRAAGFAPVVRWVDTLAQPPCDYPYKTIEALTILDRRAERDAKKKKR